MLQKLVSSTLQKLLEDQNNNWKTYMMIRVFSDARQVQKYIIGLVYSHEQMKCEHEKINQYTERARFISARVRVLMWYYCTIEDLKICLSKYTLNEPLCHLHYPCSLNIRVLVPIFVFSFHLSGTLGYSTKISIVKDWRFPSSDWPWVSSRVHFVFCGTMILKLSQGLYWTG